MAYHGLIILIVNNRSTGGYSAWCEVCDDLSSLCVLHGLGCRHHWTRWTLWTLAREMMDTGGMSGELFHVWSNYESRVVSCPTPGWPSPALSNTAHPLASTQAQGRWLDIQIFG